MMVDEVKERNVNEVKEWSKNEVKEWRKNEVKVMVDAPKGEGLDRILMEGGSCGFEASASRPPTERERVCHVSVLVAHMGG